jgi:hypothetical protein
MTDNKRMREGGDRCCRASKELDEDGKHGGHSREISREEYRGGYDPGFLTGGYGYRRTGEERDGCGGDARADDLGGYDREISRGKYRGAMIPASLVKLFAAAPTARQSPTNDANKPWERNTSPYSMEWNHDWFNRSRLSTPTDFHQTYRATNI